MYKLIFILYTITNIYDCFINSRDTPTNNMKDIIENQQYREDQLREKCNLGNFMIESKKNIYETIYSDIKYYLTEQISANIYPALYNNNIECGTYEEFMKNSYQKININKNLIYNEKIFTLKNNNPVWILELDDMIIEITDIKLFK